MQIHGVDHGFAHGRMHIFARTGELIATASQSLILRLWG
jgi:acyl-CoA thioesterase II